ncbi:MAG: type II toxin-antitoxin system RelE/ParE family toxin [Actinobacteria bacterium]|nr:type II toxin-antitoxin system RelE/ParE family toxin [Actinomycetota bacterium]
MKHYEVVVLPHVHEQVEEIRAYQHAMAPNRAQCFIDAWEACIKGLERNPTKAKHKGPYGHVMLMKLPYRVVIRVAGSKVVVHQVRHTRRKPSKKFGP